MTIVKLIVGLASLAFLQACTCKNYTTSEDEQIRLSTDDKSFAFSLMDLDEFPGLDQLGYFQQDQYWVATADDIQVIALTDHDYTMKFLVSSKSPDRLLGPGFSKGKRRLYLAGTLAHEFDMDQGEVVVDRLQELNYTDSVIQGSGFPWSWWAEDYAIPVDMKLDHPGYEFSGEQFYVSRLQLGRAAYVAASRIEFNFPLSTSSRSRVSYEIPFTVDKTQYWIDFTASYKRGARECEFGIGVPASH